MSSALLQDGFLQPPSTCNPAQTDFRNMLDTDPCFSLLFDSCCDMVGWDRVGTMKYHSYAQMQLEQQQSLVRTGQTPLLAFCWHMTHVNSHTFHLISQGSGQWGLQACSGSHGRAFEWHTAVFWHARQREPACQ